MSQLTVCLPDPLHHQLITLANHAGVSLNQYLVSLLTRQTTTAYTVQLIPQATLAQQRLAFDTLLQHLGTASPEEIQAVLAEREPIEPEAEISAEMIERFRQRWVVKSSSERVGHAVSHCPLDLAISTNDTQVQSFHLEVEMTAESWENL